MSAYREAAVEVKAELLAGGDVELETVDGPARGLGGFRCTTVLDESEDDGDEEEGEAIDEDGTRD